MLQTDERTVTEILPYLSNSSPEINKTRIAPYCRVSTNSNEQEHSFAAQLQYYKEYVEKLPNSELVDIYADEGISGRDTRNRDDFNRLLNDCKKGKIDRIVTKSVSRFARNTVDCLENVRILSSYGVTVYFEKEDIDTAKMSNEMLLAISGIQAQEESVSHGNNMRWSYQKRMKKGEFLGTVATYGYILINSGNVIINEAEAKVVRLIKDLYLAGLGCQKIADYLNQNGILRRNGKQWHDTTIKYILTNERYVGDALLQKNITTCDYPPRKIRNKGFSTQYYVKNCLPAIFTREERENILNLFKKRRQSIYNKGGHKLSLMFRCPKCGRSFRRLEQRNSVVWRCSNNVSGKGCDYSNAIEETDAQNMLIDVINKLYLNRESLIVPLIEKLELMQSKLNGTEGKLKSIDKEIATLCKQSLVLSELIKNGILETADFYSQQNNISARLAEVRKNRRECLAEQNNDETLKAVNYLNETLEDIETVLTEYEEDIIRAIIKDVTVMSGSEMQINLHCGLILTEYLPTYYSRRG